MLESRRTMVWRVCEFVLVVHADSLLLRIRIACSA
jgi:hypothetical protein